MFIKHSIYITREGIIFFFTRLLKNGKETYPRWPYEVAVIKLKFILSVRFLLAHRLTFQPAVAVGFDIGQTNLIIFIATRQFKWSAGLVQLASSRIPAKAYFISTRRTLLFRSWTPRCSMARFATRQAEITNGHVIIRYVNFNVRVRAISVLYRFIKSRPTRHVRSTLAHVQPSATRNTRATEGTRFHGTL